jgi:hypothetical protein
MATYHWTGTLLFDDTNMVTLPAISLATTAKTNQFCAKVSKPNGSNDMYADNDSLVTPFTTVPNYPSSFIIQMLTNNAASETSYFIADDMGHIVYQKSGFANTKLYKDTVTLPNGCYHFEIDDAGKDGLSFFANSDGNGTLSFYKLSPHTQFKTFQADFGTSAIQNFTVGAVTGVDEPVITEPDYNVYPNPASDEINVAHLTSSDKDKDIRIYTEMGTLVYAQHIKAGADKCKVNTSGFAQGLYCVVISNTDGVIVKKMVISR